MLPILASLLLTLAPPAPTGGTVTVKGKRFLADVAQTQEEQARGMMGRREMGQDHCMFFLYDEDGQRPIWMKNCFIGLDVAWINAGGQVVELAEACPPCSPLLGDNCPNYGGRVVSRHFVEFPSGTIKRIGLKKGDVLAWDLVLRGGGTAKGGGQAAPKAAKKTGK